MSAALRRPPANQKVSSGIVPHIAVAMRTPLGEGAGGGVRKQRAGGLQEGGAHGGALAGRCFSQEEHIYIYFFFVVCTRLRRRGARQSGGTSRRPSATPWAFSSSKYSTELCGAECSPQWAKCAAAALQRLGRVQGTGIGWGAGRRGGPGSSSQQ